MSDLLTIDWAQFHFLRPHWLWALLLLLPLAVWAWAANQGAGVWKKIVDPALQPLMLSQGQTQRQWPQRLWLCLLWLLAVLALAGPTWQERPTPLLRSEQARIVVLDLSRSMLANDLRPSRLALARLKVQDLLQQSRDSKAGLLVFAAQAFPIAPLTDDIQTLLSQVPSLHPDLMPAQGGRIDRALLQAGEMLKQAGIQGGAGRGGQVLLVTDSKPQEAAFAAAQTLRDVGYALSVLAVGSEAGAPIPADSRRGKGFVKGQDGNIVIAKLATAELRQLALAGGGQFSLLSADNSDIEKLTKVLAPAEPPNQQNGDTANAGDQWLEAGPFLLLLLLPLAALGFRRGWLMAAVLMLALPGGVEEAYAQADIGSSWWFNADQRAKQALDAGDAKTASQLFESPDWQAAAQYRAGDYQAAAEYWGQQQNAQAFYNQANALAQIGELQAAITAWQQVPEGDGLYESAQHNIALIQPLLDQQSAQDADNNQQQSPPEEGDSEQAAEQQGQSQESSQDSSQNGQQGQQQGSQSAENASGQASEQNADEPSHTQSAADSQPVEEPTEEDLEQAQAEQQEGSPAEQAQNKAAVQTAADAQEQAQEQVLEQWLNRVPDDPGGLLREKFKRDYQRRVRQRSSEYQDEEQAW